MYIIEEDCDRQLQNHKQYHILLLYKIMRHNEKFTMHYNSYYKLNRIFFFFFKL